VKWKRKGSKEGRSEVIGGELHLASGERKTAHVIQQRRGTAMNRVKLEMTSASRRGLCKRPTRTNEKDEPPEEIRRR